MKDRFAFVDWAKTLGIMCVCVGHFLLKESPKKIFLYSFHIPLFFLVSGFLSPSTGETVPWKTIRKLSHRILIPYTVWFWLSAIAQIWILKDTWRSCVALYLFADGMTLWNYPLWFMPCFYMVSVFHCLCRAYYAHDDFKRNLLLTLISFTVAYILNVWLDSIDENFMLLGLNKSTLMLGYQCLGALLRLVYQNRKQWLKQFHKLGIPLFLGFGMLSCYLNDGNNISILFSDLNNVFRYIVLSVAMSISFLWSCMALPQSRVVELLAKNTIPLMCSHYVLIPVLYPYLSPTQALYKTVGLWVSLGFFVFVIVVSQISKRHPRLGDCLSVLGFRL